jgi:hypothetical protein
LFSRDEVYPILQNSKILPSFKSDNFEHQRNWLLKTFGQSILKKMTSVNKELEEFNNENDEGINDLPDFENQMNNNELEEFVEPDIDAKEEDETIMEKMKNFAKKGLLRYTVG